MLMARPPSTMTEEPPPSRLSASVAPSASTCAAFLTCPPFSTLWTSDPIAFRTPSSCRARTAFDLDAEPESVRRRYNRVPWIDQFGRSGKMNDQVLQARRLVEHGVPFVTVVLSARGNSATWDIHGNPIKTAYGGVETGLKPLLAPFDHLLSTLIDDLEERGLLDDTLVVALGEFGRSPRINKNTGRDHWPAVGGGVLAGGGLSHGRTIGSTDRQGGSITSQKVEPADIAALLTTAPVSVDELIRQSGAGAAAVQLALLELEIAGRLERHAAGRVSLR